MSEQGNDDDTTSDAEIGTVRPWQTLASLGITESDLTTVRQGPLSAHRLRSERCGDRHHHVPTCEPA